MSNFKFAVALWQYIRPYRWRVLFILLGLTVEFSYEAGLRYSLKFLVDDVILKNKPDIFFLLFALFAAGGVVYTFFAVICDYFWAKYGSRIFSDLCHDLFRHLQLLPMEYNERQSTGDLMSRFSLDAATIDNALVIVLPAAFLSIGELLVSSALLLQLSPLLFSGVLVGMVICLSSPNTVAKQTNSSNYELSRYNGQLGMFLQEHLSAFTMIHAYGLENHVTGQYRQKLKQFVTVASRANFFSYISQRMPNLAFLILNIVVLFAAGLLVMQGRMSVGSLVSYQIIFVSMSAAINHMTWIIPNLLSAKASMQRLQEVLEVPLPPEEEHYDNESVHFTGEVEYRHVGFSYNNGQPVLNDLSFRIEPKSFTVFVGPSGSGKTTLINLLLRFYEPTTGLILINEIESSMINPRLLRSFIGVVAQEVSLFNLSIAENIRMGNLDADQEAIEKAAKQAEIHEFIISLPEQYETLCGEAGGLLSGGQRQRIALARALVREPLLLLLDEATSALDPLTEQDILKTILKLRSQCTIVAITHKLNLAVEADMTFVMDKGSIVEQGTHNELLNNNGLYVRFWNHTEELEETVLTNSI
ncbi:ABC transporter ATP-binding protein [Chlorobium sp. BLA1]|uniref:ABC transporter ATP-binding protein n=1 Tax=Candidatus Chlorobium masyuteum TaxID=2716876 RepID=UPI0014231C45|nr:ABC transporter ATP-binding protein [Candidatus Chlorobium masyuteum]NHQ61051.1 ABC transporter ATP-binding protein [Candidatus Chlorobium masyuteum]